MSRFPIISYKHQRGFQNYFFSSEVPTIKLYNPVVSWKENNNISFRFEKITEHSDSITTDNLKLLIYLRDLNNGLVKSYLNYKSERNLPDKAATPCLYYEKGNSFYIKCHNSTGKIIKLGNTFPVVEVSVKNVWEAPNGTIGFRLEIL